MSNKSLRDARVTLDSLYRATEGSAEHASRRRDKSGELSEAVSAGVGQTLTQSRRRKGVQLVGAGQRAGSPRLTATSGLVCGSPRTVRRPAGPPASTQQSKPKQKTAKKTGLRDAKSPLRQPASLAKLGKQQASLQAFARGLLHADTSLRATQSRHTGIADDLAAGRQTAGSSGSLRLVRGKTGKKGPSKKASREVTRDNPQETSLAYVSLLCSPSIKNGSHAGAGEQPVGPMSGTDTTWSRGREGTSKHTVQHKLAKRTSPPDTAPHHAGSRSPQPARTAGAQKTQKALKVDVTGSKKKQKVTVELAMPGESQGGKKAKSASKDRRPRRAAHAWPRETQPAGPAGELQRHYLLGLVARAGTNSSDLSTCQRSTVKLGQLRQWRLAGQAADASRTRKPQMRGQHQADDSDCTEQPGDEDRAAETIQKFYRDWNSGQLEDRDADAKAHTGLAEGCQKARYRDGLSFGVQAHHAGQVSHSLSSGYDQEISLCLSHTKYTDRKQGTAVVVVAGQGLDSRGPVLTPNSFDKLDSRPDIFRSIFKIVSSAKKQRAGAQSAVAQQQVSSGQDQLKDMTECHAQQDGIVMELHLDASTNRDDLAAQQRCDQPSVPPIDLNNLHCFAREEYGKWNKVTSLLHVIEGKLGGRAADEVHLLFRQLEAFAEGSKKNVKEAFFPLDSAVSQGVSELGTFRQDSSRHADSFFERKKALCKALPVEAQWRDRPTAQQLDWDRGSSVEAADSPAQSQRVANVRRAGNQVALERWVDQSVLVRSSSSGNLLEKQQSQL